MSRYSSRMNSKPIVRSFWWAVFGIVLFAIVSTANAQTIKLGMVTTLSGIFSSTGQSGLDGAKLAVEEFNSKGGVLGRNLELIAVDARLSPDIGALTLKDLILKEKIDFALGPVSSSVALAMSDVAREFRVPLILHTSNTERLTVERGHRYVFQLAPDTYMEGAVAAVYAAQKPWGKLVIISQDNDYGATATAAFKEKIKKLRPDINIAKELSVKPDRPDFEPYIDEIIKARPDAVYAALKYRDLVFFLMQFKEKKIPVISRNDWEAKDLWDRDLYRKDSNFADLIDGMVVYSPAPYFAINDSGIKDFTKYFLGRTGGKYPSDWAVMAYDAVWVLVQAIQMAKTVDREKVVEALLNAKFKTLRGTIYFRKEDHMASVPFYVGTAKRSAEFPFFTIAGITAIPADQLWRPSEEVLKLRKR